MKERPILFSGQMVRAILAGTKTQTRRVVKPQPVGHADVQFRVAAAVTLEGGKQLRCPYGQPGDRLWVREAWSQPTNLDPGPTFYRADYPYCVPAHFENVPPVDQIKWKPSIHMRRDQSRILLEVIAVRVERLQDISGSDAAAEGVQVPCDDQGRPLLRLTGRVPPSRIGKPVQDWTTDDFLRFEYAELWEQINGGGSWDANPWVWAISFRRIDRA